MGVDPRHKGPSPVSISNLVNRTEPVIEDDLARITPGVVHGFKDLGFGKTIYMQDVSGTVGDLLNELGAEFTRSFKKN